MTAPALEVSMLNLFKHEFRSRLGAILGWGLGLTLFGAMYISIFPEIEDQVADLADLAIYRAMGIDMSSFAGFIASVVLLFLPVLLGIYAVITSTGALAGEEDSGTLELVLAMPLKRWQILTTKAAAISLAALLILVIAGVGNALVLRAVQATAAVDVTPLQLFGAILNGWPITLVFIMLGLFLSAYLPNRRAAALALTVIFVASFFGKTLASMVASLEPIRPFLLFTYLDSSITVFTKGVQAGDVAVLLVIAAVFFVLALLSFQRRNVTVGAWPWQRPRVS
jgi:ABC-2 type transport system permease protein